MNRYKQFWPSLLACVFLLFSTFEVSAQEANANVNGIWTNSTNDYLLLMQAEGSQQVIGVMVAVDLSSSDILNGTLDGNQLMLTSLTDSSTQITMEFSSETMATGTLFEGESQTSFTSTLSFAYKSSPYDGVWLADLDEQYYFAYFTVTFNAASFAVAITAQVLSETSIAIEVYAGGVTNTIFSGVSLNHASHSITLDFNDQSHAAGTLIERGSTPIPTRTPFSAEKIIDLVDLSPSAPSFSF